MRRYYVSHLMQEEEMKKSLELPGIGVESIEFSISDNLDHLEEKIEDYRQWMERMKVRVHSVHGPFLDLNPMSFERMVREASRSRYEQAYRAARELGAEKIVFHTGFLPEVNFVEGWAERMVEFYQEFLQGKPGDLQVVMENVFDPFPEPLLKVAEAVDHPAFGICLDIGHAHCYSQIPCEEWLKVLGNHIRHLHLHDNHGDRDSHLALGEGTIPLRELKRWMAEHPEVSGTFECRSLEDVRTSWKILEEI